ncbi:NAD(P)-binding domain-containing protein, partial [Actinomadura sp. HBU206391]|uniref:NAD(P)-binding domain-containing protein n=1 Tax=Actinomadura sp. HBU206391 TaxID=2731692 RepID=UPI001DE885AC
MCANLVKAGYRVVASDARPECEGAAVECGALWSPRTAAVAGVAHVLITMLPGPREVEEAMAGAGDAVDALPAGAVGLDMTSNSPVVAGPIRERALGRGIDVLEAPAGGGVAAARARALQLFVGGDADVLQRPASNCEMNDSASRSGSAG